MIFDFQTGSDALPFTSAFKDVIFRNTSSLIVERPLGVLQNKLGLDGNFLASELCFVIFFVSNFGFIN